MTFKRGESERIDYVASPAINEYTFITCHANPRPVKHHSREQDIVCKDYSVIYRHKTTKTCDQSGKTETDRISLPIRDDDRQTY